MPLTLVVAPFVGVWIEISNNSSSEESGEVAPFVGVWIEIKHSLIAFLFDFVAPFVGVWIEMLYVMSPKSYTVCRSLRGSVD